MISKEDKKLVKSIINKSVNLTYEDILNISKYLCTKDDELRIFTGTAFLEYLLFDAIKTLKNVNFFEEEEIKKI